MTKHRIYQGREDYLKTMLKLSNEETWISNKQLASVLGVSAPSASEMVRKLEMEGLVQVVAYRGSRLTDAGRNMAIHLIRSHRLWEVFLIEYLQYDPSEADAEAELLEHSSTIKLTEALEKFLNYPTHCPHGAVIPEAEAER